MGKILVCKIKTYHVTCPNDFKMTFGIPTFFSTMNKSKIYKRKWGYINYLLLTYSDLGVFFGSQIFWSLRHTHGKKKKKDCLHGLFYSLLHVDSENTKSLLLTEKKNTGMHYWCNSALTSILKGIKYTFPLLVW